MTVESTSDGTDRSTNAPKTQKKVGTRAVSRCVYI